MLSVTPESRGIPSAAIEAYLRLLEANHLATHDVIIARGDSVVFEHYWKPFERDFIHRMYSVTKSFVAIAVGFALQDGLLSLDDPMDKYFHAELEGQTDDNQRYQTVRDMMMMSTAKSSQNWFAARSDDRVRFYFQNPDPRTRKPGTKFEYDSTGTFVIGALVERLTGKTLMAYLWEKLFRHLGISESAKFLTCPGGHSWSDSALIMRPCDLLLVARFLMNGGCWNGEQLLDAEFVRTATARLIPTRAAEGIGIEGQGYGYYIWKAYGEGFFFNGMGCQLALCVPEKDMILIYNGDNQGRGDAKNIVLDGFYQLVVSSAGEPLPADPDANRALEDYAAPLKLAVEQGNTDSPIAPLVNHRWYRLDPNPMGITRLCVTFGEPCTVEYVNAQGEKCVCFGMGENRSGEFPQEGYSDLVGSQPGKRLYRCAVSAAWKSENELRIKTQIIDDYFGNMTARLTFAAGGLRMHLAMTKTAEDFLDEYWGEADGSAEPPIYF